MIIEKRPDGYTEMFLEEPAYNSRYPIDSIDKIIGIIYKGSNEVDLINAEIVFVNRWCELDVEVITVNDLDKLKAVIGKTTSECFDNNWRLK